MNNKIIVFLVLVTFIAFVINGNWWLRDIIRQIQTDLTTTNGEITTKSEIDDIISVLQELTFSDLDADYLDYTKTDDSKYKALIKNQTFYKIPREYLNRKNCWKI